jgi:hypothetical protein
MAVKPSVIAFVKVERSTACDRSTEDIIGESVKAMTPETSTAAASVKANSLNSVPVTPPRNPIGA